ncbi:MAG: AAA family ATPase, partial [Verrucomicrobiae bacterium]|nr:AAA family ATPase [Verrucomicrobiae bacterium]
VWGSYRFVVVADGMEADGLKVIDLGAGHASSHESLCGRVILALKAQNLLNESVGAGYIERNWPRALKESGAWPLSGLRQSFLNGSLTRLLDPDATLRGKITEFVSHGDFGLASGPKPDGTYESVWFEQPVSADEVMFEANVFLLTKGRAKSLKTGAPPAVVAAGQQPPEPERQPDGNRDKQPQPVQPVTLTVSGTVPPEIWNRLGTKILPKLKSGTDLQVGVHFTVTVPADSATSLEKDLEQILADLGLGGSVRVEKR